MDTLRTTGDVGQICLDAGLRSTAQHPLADPAWLDDQVSVRIVNGYVGWQVSVRDGMGGLLVCEVGDDTRSPELLRLAIGEARRIHSEVRI